MPSGARGGVPNGTTTFYGAYVQGETEFSVGALGRVILLPGVRWDRFESDSDIGGANEDEAISARFGATRAPVEPVRIFASWSEAFRAPSLNELYLDGTHFSIPHPILGAPTFITNVFIPNPALRPESSETFEIGAGYTHTGLFTASDRLEVKGTGSARAPMISSIWRWISRLIPPALPRPSSRPARPAPLSPAMWPMPS